MRKMLLIYMILIGALIIYIMQYRLDEKSAAWTEQGLKGNIDENYVMVTFQSGMEYWKSGLKGFEDAAEALNVSVEYRGATQYDAREQALVLDQIIAKKPAGIAISAIDSPALVKSVNKAVDAGIPVVMFDAEASGSKAYSFLATDNTNAGTTAADQMAKLTKHQGKIAIITLTNQQNHKERTQGFEEEIKHRYPQMKIVAVENHEGDAVKAEQITTQLLRQYPDLKGIFITEATGSYGVGRAVEQSGRTGASKPVIISFDTNKETLDMIKSGTINATIAQGTWNMGYWSLQYLFHLHHGLTVPARSLSGIVSPVPVRVDTGISVVTPENVADYYAK